MDPRSAPTTAAPQTGAGISQPERDPVQTSAQHTPAAAVIIYAPKSCGENLYSDALAAYYGKTMIIDEWRPGQPLTTDTLALTNVAGVNGAIAYADAIAVLMQHPKSVWQIDGVKEHTGLTEAEIFLRMHMGEFPKAIHAINDHQRIVKAWSVVEVTAWKKANSTGPFDVDGQWKRLMKLLDAESPQDDIGVPYVIVAALVAADMDFEATGAVSPQTMQLIRDLLAEMGIK